MGNIISYREAHGTIATFETDVVEKIKNLMIDIEPVQDGSGDPSPDNVRPITGWTGASVHVTGANLWGGTALASDLVAISSVVQGSDDYGNYVRLAAAYASKKIYFSKFKPNTVYTVILTLKKSNTSGLTNLRIVYTDGTTQNIARNGREADVVETFVVTTTAGKSVDYIGGSNQSGNTYLYYDECGVFEGVLTANNFVAYASTDYSVSWETEAGEIYGGTLNVLTGRLTVTHVKRTYLSSAYWAWNESISGFVPGQNDMAAGSHYSDQASICSCFKKALSASSTADPCVVIGNSSTKQIAFCNLTGIGITDVEIWKTFLDTHDVSVTYPLAEPITYQLYSSETLHINKNTCTKMAAYIGSNGNIGAKSNCNLIYFKCQPGTTYTITKILSARFRAAYTSTTPTDGMATSGLITNNTGTVIDITPPSDAQYLLVYYYDGDNETLSENEIYNSLDITYNVTTSITWEVNSTVGKNNIYANTGDTLVIYPKIITPVETISSIRLIDLRRNIITAMQHDSGIKTYGVEWNYSNPSTILTRTGNAANFSNPIPATSNSNTGSSPFDNIYPWSEMKRYNIINGEVTYSEDDTGYSETDYDTVVYIPKFYYKAEKDTTNQKWNWSISSRPIEGYEKHPGSGRYVGRFHTSGSSSGVFSKSGVMPLASTTRANFRTYSHNKGNNWWQIDIKTWSAIQLLYLIEFANWNSKDRLNHGQNSGAVVNTGATTNAAYHTLKRVGASGNMYRWIENPYSNLWIWLDGYITNDRVSYIILTNPANYNDDVDNSETVGINIPSTNFITGFGYSNKCTWAFIPDTALSNADHTTYVTDKCYSATDLRNLITGGHYMDYNQYGFFYFNATYTNSNAVDKIGSRLIYIPTT